MNKKDLINSFESLTPDQSQKEKMLTNVLNAGMKKNVHKMSFNFRYTFTTIAAAVCVVAVVITVRPWYGQKDQGQAPNKEISYDIPYNTHGSQIIAKEDTAESDKSTVIDNHIYTADNLPPETAAENGKNKHAEVQAKAEPEIPADGNADATEYAADVYADSTPTSKSSRMIIAEEEAVKAYVPQLNINQEGVTGGSATTSASGGGGGGASVTISDEDITLQEYYDYIGINLESVFDIPDGFSNVTRKYGTYDQWMFNYEKGNRYIHITTTKNTNYVSQKINGGYLYTDINGKKAVIFEKGKSYTAYIISDDIAYTINTYDVSEADLANLLLSIAG